MATHRRHRPSSLPAVSPLWILVTLCFAVALLSALQTLVVPVVGDIGRSLHAGAGATSWVITANLLAAAVSTPLLGRLGDLRGRRPVLLGVLVALEQVDVRSSDLVRVVVGDETDVDRPPGGALAPLRRGA